jgi:hypothetical protein
MTSLGLAFVPLQAGLWPIDNGIPLHLGISAAALTPF